MPEGGTLTDPHVAGHGAGRHGAPVRRTRRSRPGEYVSSWCRTRASGMDPDDPRSARSSRSSPPRGRARAPGSACRWCTAREAERRVHPRRQRAGPRHPHRDLSAARGRPSRRGVRARHRRRRRRPRATSWWWRTTRWCGRCVVRELVEPGLPGRGSGRRRGGARAARRTRGVVRSPDHRSGHAADGRARAGRAASPPFGRICRCSSCPATPTRRTRRVLVEGEQPLPAEAVHGGRAAEPAGRDATASPMSRRAASAATARAAPRNRPSSGGRIRRSKARNSVLENGKKTNGTTTIRMTVGDLEEVPWRIRPGQEQEPRHPDAEHRLHRHQVEEVGAQPVALLAALEAQAAHRAHRQQARPTGEDRSAPAVRAAQAHGAHEVGHH